MENNYNTYGLLVDVNWLHVSHNTVLSHLDSGECSSVLISTVSLQLAVGAHHLTLVAEPEFGLWLFQNAEIWSIMVNGCNKIQ